jgi:hypothetical protein
MQQALGPPQALQAAYHPIEAFSKPGPNLSKSTQIPAKPIQGKSLDFLGDPRPTQAFSRSCADPRAKKFFSCSLPRGWRSWPERLHPATGQDTMTSDFLKAISAEKKAGSVF